MDKPKYALGSYGADQRIKLVALIVMSGMANLMGWWLGFSLAGFSWSSPQFSIFKLIGPPMMGNLALLAWTHKNKTLLTGQAIGAGLVFLSIIVLLLLFAYIFRNINFSGLIFM